MVHVLKIHLACCLLTTWLSSALPDGAGAQVAVKGRMLYTMAGPSIPNGVVLIQDGKIIQVGLQSRIAIPANYEVLEAAVVTPGLIDAHTVVGLAGQYNYDHDQDQLERSEPIQPDLRAIDAYNAKERLIEWVRQFGVTTIHTGHAPGELISGQTMIVKTTGNSVEEAVIRSPAAIAATLGEAALKGRGQKKSPGTRSKMVSLLREKFVAAQEYGEKRSKAATESSEDSEEQKDKDSSPARKLELEILTLALKGEIPVLITAHRAQDIANALRLAEEFNLDLILDGATEAYLLIEHIRDAGCPVIIHPTLQRAYGETKNMSYETAGKLAAAGIPMAFQSGFENYVPKTRVVLFEAAYAAANGMSFDQTLAAITIEAARILKIDESVGSLEAGKDADLALYDGDPFEYTTHCVGVVVDGSIVSSDAH